MTDRAVNNPGSGRLRVAATRGELATGRAALAGQVAVVMTMGALHAGHAELIRRAREVADSVVVTIFVNPLQFGVGEDLDRYPRTLVSDLLTCEQLGVDLVFTPSDAEVYPEQPTVRVSAGRLGARLEGASRPGHFDGVLTVVLKLLHLVRPQLALFGQKDAQQLACIQAMVRDLDVGVQVLGVPIVRESDGLALSSRNRFLSPTERRAALALSRALATGELAAAAAVLADEPGLVLDYLDRVDSLTFDSSTDGDLLVVAAQAGAVRLIDNRLIDNRLIDNRLIDNRPLDNRAATDSRPSTDDRLTEATP